MLAAWGTPLAADLEDVLRSMGLTRFKRSGRNIMIKCPFHEDGHPSCGVHREKGVFNCFTATCGAKGDLVDLAVRLLNLEDKIAGYKWLVSRFAAVSKEERPDLLKAFSSLLYGEAPVLYPSEAEMASYRWRHPYIYTRGITDETADAFELGYDRELGAVTVPWHDVDGRVAFVKKRSIAEKKYLNNADILKGQHVYGLWIAKEKGLRRVAMVEGEFSCMWLWQNGVPAVCIGGSVPTKDQMRLLLRSGVILLDLFLDNPLIDKAGAAGVAKIKAEYGRYFRIREAVYPSLLWKDPNEIPADNLPLPPAKEREVGASFSGRVTFV